jgi:serine/threonine protein phosphatase PrpC
MIDADVCSGATDVGLKRENNQDQFLIARLNKSMLITQTSLPIDPEHRLCDDSHGDLMLVADGMGGHAAGECASKMAIENLVERMLNQVHWFFQIGVDAEHEFIESLKTMLRATHKRIQEEGRKTASLSGMGTTLTMTYIVWPKMYVLHAGDSRCYLIRDGMVDLLTTDHTLARRMIESGGMKPEDEEGSRWSNVLWNVLGGKSEVALTAEVRSVTLREGDTVVLCTDGLHRHLNDDLLVRVLERFPSSQEACDALVKIANDSGGDDNITVIVSRPQPPAGYANENVLDTDIDLGPTPNFETYNPHETLPG